MIAEIVIFLNGAWQKELLVLAKVVRGLAGGLALSFRHSRESGNPGQPAIPIPMQRRLVVIRGRGCRTHGLADQGLAVGSEDGRGSSARIEIEAARGWTP